MGKCRHTEMKCQINFYQNLEVLGFLVSGRGCNNLVVC